MANNTTIMDGTVKWRLTNMLLSTQKKALMLIARLAIPIGSIITFAANAKFPAGFLVCNGEEVSKYDYPELYEIIGDKYGYASKNTFFKLPNLVNKVILGDLEAGNDSDNIISPANEDEENAIRMLTTSMVYLIKAEDILDDNGFPLIVGNGGGTTALATHVSNGLMSFGDKINLDTKFHQTNTAYSIGEKVAVQGQPNYLYLECTKPGITGKVAPSAFEEPDVEYYKTNTRYSFGDQVKVPGQPYYLVLECINSSGGSTGPTMPDFGEITDTEEDFEFYRTNTTYKVGDVVRVPNQPSYLVLECIEGGTTSDEMPDFDDD